VGVPVGGDSAVTVVQLHPDERCCAMCGTSLDGRRSSAIYCGGACRADASRLRRLLSGQQVDGYCSVWDFLQAIERKRTDARVLALAGDQAA
jgi:hypothetical protein